MTTKATQMLEKAVKELEKTPNRAVKNAIMSKNTQINNSNEQLNENKQSSFSALDLINTANEKIPFLIENLLPKVGLSALIGGSDNGKSSMLRQMALSIVSGQDFIGFPTNGVNKSVVYLSTEDDRTAIAPLLKRQCAATQTTQQPGLAIIPSTDNTKTDKIEITQEELNRLYFYFDSEYFLTHFEEILMEKHPDLAIIDCFADLFFGELYETNKVRNFLNIFQQYAVKYQCSILFLHHVGKRTEDLSPSKNNALGSQGFEAKMRLVVELKTDKAQPQKKFFCIVKGNYLPHDMKKYAYNLIFNDNLIFTNTNQLTAFENINKAGSDLSEKERDYNDIMQMRSEGMTYKEIGDKMGLSQTGVINRVKRYEDQQERIKQQTKEINYKQTELTDIDNVHFQ